LRGLLSCPQTMVPSEIAKTASSLNADDLAKICLRCGWSGCDSNPCDSRPRLVNSDNLEEFTLPAQLPVTVPSELVHRRPDVLSAEAQLHAATAAVGIAAANLYPQVSISASGTLQATTLGTLFNASSRAGGVAANLTAPLFNHGALKARQRAAVETMHAALSTYEQTVLHAFTEVADALEFLNQDADAVHSEQSAMATASENLALTRESYRVGNSGVLQVLEAQRQSGRARDELLSARVRRLQDTVELLVAVGGAPSLGAGPPP